MRPGPCTVPSAAAAVAAAPGPALGPPASSRGRSRGGEAAGPGRNQRCQRCRASRGFGGMLKEKRAERAESGPSAGRCPCGSASGLSYARCCNPYHAGKKAAESPRKLLETRFAAYSKGLADYVVRTAQMPGSKKKAKDLIKDIDATCKKLRFISLNVLEEAEHEDHAVIKFRFTVRTRAQRGFREGADEDIEETSHFVKEGGVWLFNEGMTDTNPRALDRWVVLPAEGAPWRPLAPPGAVLRCLSAGLTHAPPPPPFSSVDTSKVEVYDQNKFGHRIVKK